MSTGRAWLARDDQVQFGDGLVVSVWYGSIGRYVCTFRFMGVGQDDGAPSPPTASPRDHGEQHESTPTHAEYMLLLSYRSRVTHTGRRGLLGACIPRRETRSWWRFVVCRRRHLCELADRVARNGEGVLNGSSPSNEAQVHRPPLRTARVAARAPKGPDCRCT